LAKKTNSGGMLLLVGLGGVIYLVSSIPKEIWIAVGVAVVTYFLYKTFKKQDVTIDEEPPIQSRRPAGKHVPRAPLVSQPRFSDEDEPVSVVREASTPTSAFKVPTAPKGLGQAQWIAPGVEVTVGNLNIPGGLVYVGTKLSTPMGGNDPSLIDPSKSIAARGSYTERQFGYWPSYSEISSSARRAYLNWLADGRKDPEADIGYVFLFFYGLERRVIVDGSKENKSKEDWPAIAAEIRRLLSIYGDKSNSFRRYASELLDWVSLAEHDGKLYSQPIPSFPKTYELPLYVRVALGQAAVDGAPVPSDLALVWARMDPAVALRTPAVRCSEQFEVLFHQKYTELFGEGWVLPKNRTKLKLVYRPASAGFQGYTTPTLTFGDTPDISVLTGPIKKLQDLVESATKELEPYSRFVAKNPEGKASLEGLLQLPATLWPEEPRQALDSLKGRMGAGMLVLPFDELQKVLGAQSTLTKDKVLALARALESMNIGVEPDILGGAKVPKTEDQVILFAVPPGESSSRSTPTYQAAALTLQLASAVASADGEFTVKEVSHLREQVQSWSHLPPNHLRRLMAHLRLLMVAPVSLTALKKKLEPLDMAAKETIAAFMATVAQSDGTVTPDEVKMLEKVYKALGVEPKKVFSDVHTAAAGGAPSPAAKAKAPGFTLDPARIAALQQDTAKVTALLSNIFQEEPVPAAPPEPVIEAESEVQSTGLLDLDMQHSSLARLLLSRPNWTRAELQDVAADLDLMLDGALEHINEAAFDKFDIPFTEGDDPVEVNAEILEKIEA